MQANGVWSLQPLADMSAAEFRDWQVLLENRTGVVLNEQRRTFLQASLTARMRELGIGDYHSYYRQVTDGPRGAIGVGDPAGPPDRPGNPFLPSSPVFRAARALPGRSPAPRRHAAALGPVERRLLQRRGTLLAGDVRRAGVARAGTGRFFGVTGTDISLHALQRARQANYPARKLEQLEAGLVERYCERQADGSFSVKTILTERVCCARLNVLDLAKAPWSGMDVIFCQNLLIYFRRWRRREILSRLAERLAPGGLLVIGVGEVVDWSHPELEPVADERVLAFTRKGYSGT